MIEIIHAHMPEHIGEIRSLFEQYASSLGFDLHFQHLDDELYSLPGEYVPPAGALLMAQERSVAIGCVAMRPLEKRTCEMKRLYVVHRFRGKGIGRLLAESIIDEAKHAGYKRMRLNTVSSMREAIALYESLGFKEIEPYRYNPVP